MGYVCEGQPAEKRVGVEDGAAAGLGIVGGAIGHSLSVMAARGHLLKEVPMACGHLSWRALIAIHQWW